MSSNKKTNGSVEYFAPEASKIVCGNDVVRDFQHHIKSSVNERRRCSEVITDERSYVDGDANGDANEEMGLLEKKKLAGEQRRSSNNLGLLLLGASARSIGDNNEREGVSITPVNHPTAAELADQIESLQIPFRHRSATMAVDDGFACDDDDDSQQGLGEFLDIQLKQKEEKNNKGKEKKPFEDDDDETFLSMFQWSNAGGEAPSKAPTAGGRSLVGNNSSATVTADSVEPSKSLDGKIVARSKSGKKEKKSRKSSSRRSKTNRDEKSKSSRHSSRRGGDTDYRRSKSDAGGSMKSSCRQRSHSRAKLSQEDGTTNLGYRRTKSGTRSSGTPQRSSSSRRSKSRNRHQGERQDKEEERSERRHHKKGERRERREDKDQRRSLRSEETAERARERIGRSSDRRNRSSVQQNGSECVDSARNSHTKNSSTCVEEQLLRDNKVKSDHAPRIPDRHSRSNDNNFEEQYHSSHDQKREEALLEIKSTVSSKNTPQQQHEDSTRNRRETRNYRSLGSGMSETTTASRQERHRERLFTRRKSNESGENTGMLQQEQQDSSRTKRETRNYRSLGSGMSETTAVSRRERRGERMFMRRKSNDSGGHFDAQDDAWVEDELDLGEVRRSQDYATARAQVHSLVAYKHVDLSTNVSWKPHHHKETNRGSSGQKNARDQKNLHNEYRSASEEEQEPLIDFDSVDFVTTKDFEASSHLLVDFGATTDASPEDDGFDAIAGSRSLRSQNSFDSDGGVLMPVARGATGKEDYEYSVPLKGGGGADGEHNKDGTNRRCYAMEALDLEKANTMPSPDSNPKPELESVLGFPSLLSSSKSANVPVSGDDVFRW